MALTLKKAQRNKAYLKLGISAPSGGGKTLGSLLIAYGLMKEKYPKESDAFRWSKIAIVDTENGSGELYVGKEVSSSLSSTTVGEYNAITLEAPFEPDKYTQAIAMCKENDIEVCIIDSTSHLWKDLLDQQSNIAKRTGNSYTAWRDITPQLNNFVDAMLQTPIHIIATMRAKQEYVQEKDEKTGKTSVRKLGMEPEQRKGMEYEFTCFYEIDASHQAFGAKDRTSLFDQKTFKIDPSVGVTLMRWLESGVDTPSEVIATSHVANKETALAEMKKEVVDLCKTFVGGLSEQAMRDVVKEYAPNGNPNSIGDVEVLKQLQVALEDLSAQSVVL